MLNAVTGTGTVRVERVVEQYRRALSLPVADAHAVVDLVVHR
jgi:hypothetical protein